MARLLFAPLPAMIAVALASPRTDVIRRDHIAAVNVLGSGSYRDDMYTAGLKGDFMPPAVSYAVAHIQPGTNNPCDLGFGRCMVTSSAYKIENLHSKPEVCAAMTI